MDLPGQACETRAARISLMTLVGTALVFCAVPGFDLLGYYACLGLGLVGGLVTGLAAAFDGGGDDGRADTLRARFKGAVTGLWPHLLIPALVLLANAVRVRNCDPIEGIAFYLMGPVASMLVASQVGTGLGLITGGRWLGLLGFAGVWLLSVGRVVVHLYLEPQVFAFHPFVGYFAGAVYDDLISIDQRFILFRVSDALVVVCVWGVAGMLRRSGGDGLVDRLRVAPSSAWACFAIGLIGWSALFGSRAGLGIETHREAIREVLGGTVNGERISVVYDRQEIEQEEAERIHRDLRYALEQLDDHLGRPHADPVEAFIYGSKEQKRALMGAGKVDLAKPWLGEIHVTRPASGDPVLKHELAHVVLGPYGGSILGVPARAQLFPHMGIVEGAAEALEWSGGSFTLHEWSAAMRQEELAPPLEQIVGAGGFWRQPPGRAYTLSGSFFRWLLETRGPEPFLKVYGDGDFRRAYGQPLGELVTGWETFLEGVELRDHARDLARRRFAAPGVFYRVCALEIAQLRQGISEALEHNDLQEALRLQEEILSHSSESIDVHLTYVALLARSGDREAITSAVRTAEAVPGLDAVATTRLRELEADGLWRAGDPTEASTGYGELMDAPQGRNRRRNVAVKAMVSADGELEPILGPYLLGPSGDREAWEPYLTEAIADLPGRVLPLYLLGRRLLAAGDADKGARLLRAALEVPTADGMGAGDIALPMIREEAQWLLGWALVETGSYGEAAALLAQQAQDAQANGRRLQLQTWADYARWLTQQTSDLK